MQKNYQPYFDAVKRILRGNPVDNLDEIREQCNVAVLGSSQGFTPEAIVLSFGADAENSILLGADPSKVYNGFNGINSADCRQRVRAILEDIVYRIR